jgi:hypothetical protein
VVCEQHGTAVLADDQGAEEEGLRACGCNSTIGLTVESGVYLRRDNVLGLASWDFLK